LIAVSLSNPDASFSAQFMGLEVMLACPLNKGVSLPFFCFKREFL